jgi:chloramphenicol-sensitive protein RarD
MLAGVAAYGIWSLFPLYFRALHGVSAWEIVAHRVLWSLVFVGAWLLIRRDVGWIRGVLANPRVLVLSGAAALLIAVNWTVYIWATTVDRVVEAALGYYINPLIVVVIGVLFLGERLRRAQWVAIALAVVAAVVLTIDSGSVPWVALTLAASFGGYGLCKRNIKLGALQGLFAETLVLSPVAIVVLAWLGHAPGLAFGHGSAAHTVLLILAGPVTAVPLVLFAVAATRIPFTVIGFLQFMTPTGQFLLAVFVFHETMTPGRWLGFAIVWCALVILSLDGLRTARSARRGHRTHEI